MGGLRHPVGPEEESTYWVRRGIVGGVLLLLLVMLFSAIGSLGNASGLEAAPAGQPVDPAPAPVDVPGSNPAPSAPDNMSGGKADDPDPAATPTATPTPAPTASAPAAAGTPKAAATPTPTPKASPTPQATPKNAAVDSKAPACNPKDLKVLVQGPRDAKAAQPVTFHFSLTNTTQQACLAEVNPATFQLLVTSGPARIWSSADCPAKFEAKRSEIAAGGVFEWDTAWTGQMSSPNCQIDAEKPQPGTYVAHAMVKDAKEASTRIVLR